MKIATISLCTFLCGAGNVSAFLASPVHQPTSPTSLGGTFTADQQEVIRNAQKQALLSLLGQKSASSCVDPVLADPETKEPISISSSGTLLGGGTRRSSIKYNVRSPTNTYSGTSDTYINLLESANDDIDIDESGSGDSLVTGALNSLRVFVPPPIRSVLTSVGAPLGDEYVPMRDLFTSPAVSFAYERGWRQGFAQAGFPGADAEFQMARDYFVPSTTGVDKSTVIDMSCATGLFTRRFAKSNEYDRVIGCDYSDSMLTEARRRINGEPELRSASTTKTKLDLVRLDVGQIPMQNESVDALHAGAAMHCWPDLPAAASEIYRVLKPNGGRYFATTFLSSYFGALQLGDATGPSSQAFQYFESVDVLRKLMEGGGFEPDKIQIEVLGAACVVIRCEK